MKIEVRTKKDYIKNTGGEIIKIIDRKPFNYGFMGNFIPHWVRYQNKEYLLKGGIDAAYIQGEQEEAYIKINQEVYNEY